MLYSLIVINLGLESTSLVVDISGGERVGMRSSSFSGLLAAGGFFDHTVVGSGVQSEFRDLLIGLNLHLQVLGTLSVSLQADKGGGAHLTNDGDGVEFTDGDDLLGEADLITVGSVFDEVLHEDASGSTLDLDDSLGEVLKGSLDSALLDAGSDFLLKFRLVLSGDSLARFRDHIGVGSDAGLLEDAHLGSLEVSESFTVKITTNTTGTSADELGSNNFNVFTIKSNFKHVLKVTDNNDTIEEGLDFNNRHAGDRRPEDNEFSLSQDLELSIDKDTGHDRTGLGLEFNDVQTNNNLDLLLGAGTTGSDSNGEGTRAILDQEMFTVIKSVRVGLIVEGGDIFTLNAATGWALLIGGPLQKTVEDAITKGQGEDILEDQGETDVFNFPFHTGTLNLQMGFFTLTAEQSFNDKFVLFQRGNSKWFITTFLQLEDEIRLDNIFDVSGNGTVSDGGGNLDLQDQLVDGCSLVADLLTDGRKLSALSLFLDATLIFKGLADGLLLAFSLGEDSFSNNLLLLGLGLESIVDHDHGLQPDIITQELFLVPLGLDFGKFSVNFSFNEEGFLEGSFEVNFGKGLDKETLLLDTSGKDNTSGLLFIMRVDRTFNGQRGGNTLLQLSQEELDLLQVLLTDLAGNLLLFTDLDGLLLSQADDLGLFTDLGGLQTLFKFLFNIHGKLLVFAELARLNADIRGRLDHSGLILKALVDFKFRLVVLNAHLLDLFMVA